MPSLAGNPALAPWTGPAAELRAARTPPERPRLLRGPAAPPPAAPSCAAAPLDRSAGFTIHQLLAARPELRAPPASRTRTIAAYQLHLATRIRFSGPVLPVDLRV